MLIKNRPIVFVDRDGTLIAEKDYLGDPRKVALISGVVQGLRALQRTGFPVVVVTNQSGVGRGFLTRGQVERVKRRFLSLLRTKNFRLSGYYACLHAPKANCPCRKPKLALLKQAAKDLGMSWKRSISVGDKLSDVRMGQRTGGFGILVQTGHGEKSGLAESRTKPDFVAHDFRQAVQWILKKERKIP